MGEYIALGIGLILAVAYVGFEAGTIYERRKAERDDLNARDKWVADYQRRNGAA